ncbi:MAG: hypothetical protein GF331_19555, partial [Chitinivibrionales bacterium]|nr:hypothetical protein [Chitinivibrionales bacterium]
MAIDYSVETCETLTQRFYDTRVHRPLRVERYDPGTQLLYEAVSVAEGTERAHLRLAVERFVGGGFAGQVYQVKVRDIAGSELPGLTPGGMYALKLLIPPSGFSLLFRNLLYAAGFQGAFQLQCNPAAARAGALWQKFIRRGAQARFGEEGVVNDVHATVVDETLGSCGEISDWVDGRTWRLEVDDRLDYLGRWLRGKPIDESLLGSGEY